jgi:hypothetical protein
VIANAYLGGFKLGSVTPRQAIRLPNHGESRPSNSIQRIVEMSTIYFLYRILRILFPRPISQFALNHLALLSLDYLESLIYHRVTANFDPLILSNAVGRENIFNFFLALRDIMLHSLANVVRSDFYNREFQIMLNGFNHYLGIGLNMPSNAYLRTANSNLSTIIMVSFFSILTLRTDWRSNPYVNHVIDLFTNRHRPVNQHTGPSSENGNQARAQNNLNNNNNNEHMPNNVDAQSIAHLVFDDTEGRTVVVNNRRARTTFFLAGGENQAEENIVRITPSFEKVMLRLALLMLIIMHLGSTYINTTNNGPRM